MEGWWVMAAIVCQRITAIVIFFFKRNDLLEDRPLPTAPTHHMSVHSLHITCRRAVRKPKRADLRKLTPAQDVCTVVPL